uniref:Pepsin-I3 domain-containing protein n=2 Tax=Brugia malayi TaxID=6279 RepID=A0A5S6P7C0_BRUMA
MIISMDIFSINLIVWLIAFGSAATIPASLSVVANGVTCVIIDNKIYVDGVYKGNATKENIEEVKIYNEKMREWAKELHNTMYTTMKKAVKEMFSDHGAFWRHLHGPFWETLNAYRPDGDLMNPAVLPMDQRDNEQKKKMIPRLPDLMPYPEAPSFCDYNV